MSNSSNFIQIVNYDGDFVGDVSTFIKEASLQKTGLDYSVVTVLGCQSSGKSTLLNRLFKTSFQVMDASAGRGQTTKGLWMALNKGVDDRNIVVVDVEGTDSKERGEDRQTFEHRASLFSLAVADCVIVNMWYHDIGRYTASNYGLLQTVLEVNLELFGHDHKDKAKTLLLFIIRDHAEAQTPLAALEKMILKDVHEIWDEKVRKPEGLETLPAERFFEFKIVGLPSLFVVPEKFNEASTELQNRFSKGKAKASDKFLKDTYSREVPADGFPIYCRQVWETIVSAKQLDIPTQKEMVGTFRCEEIKVQVVAGLQAEIAKMNALVEKGEDPNLPAKVKAVLQEGLEEYSEPASRYSKDIFEKKRSELLQAMKAALGRPVGLHIGHLRERLAREADRRLAAAVSTKGDKSSSDSGASSSREEKWAGFSDTVNQWKSDALKRFDDELEAFDTDLPEVGKVSFEGTEAKAAFGVSLSASVERIRGEEVQRLRAAVRESVSRELEKVDALLENANLQGDKFWNEVSEICATSYRSCGKTFNSSAGGLGLQMGSEEGGEKLLQVLGGGGDAEASAEDSEAALLQVAALEIEGLLRARLERVAQSLPQRVVEKFKVLFEADEDDTPRQWIAMSPSEIQKAFVKARDAALPLIDTFEKLRVDTRTFESCPAPVEVKRRFSKPVFSEGRKEAVKEKATSMMKRECSRAQEIQAAGGAPAKLPLWAYFAFLILGWNEIVMVLSNPATFFFLGILAVVGIVAFYTGNKKMMLDLGRQALGMSTSFLLPVLQSVHSAVAPQADPGGSRGSNKKTD